jgi:hypothetical protein
MHFLCRHRAEGSWCSTTRRPSPRGDNPKWTQTLQAQTYPCARSSGGTPLARSRLVASNCMRGPARLDRTARPTLIAYARTLTQRRTHRARRANRGIGAHWIPRPDIRSADVRRSYCRQSVAHALVHRRRRSSSRDTYNGRVDFPDQGGRSAHSDAGRRC